jgi:hypothetical protein
VFSFPLLDLPSQGARRATGEGSTNGWKKPQQLSAHKKTEVVLRLLRGEALDLLSRACGIPAARIAAWREAFLDAGQEAMKQQPLDSRDCEIGRLREKLGEATRAMELLREQLGRFETDRPVPRRRSRRGARPPRPPLASRMAWLASAVYGASRALLSPGSGMRPRSLAPAGGQWAPVRRTSSWPTFAVSWRHPPSQAKATARGGLGRGMTVAARRRAGAAPEACPSFARPTTAGPSTRFKGP